MVAIIIRSLSIAAKFSEWPIQRASWRKYSRCTRPLLSRKGCRYCKREKFQRPRIQSDPQDKMPFWVCSYWLCELFRPNHIILQTWYDAAALDRRSLVPHSSALIQFEEFWQKSAPIRFRRAALVFVYSACWSEHSCPDNSRHAPE